MRETSPLQPSTPTSIPQVLTPRPRETPHPRMHHDEHTRPATEYLATLCGSGGAGHGNLASSCKGYGYHVAYCLQLYP